jgi:hypothetical protein
VTCDRRRPALKLSCFVLFFAALFARSSIAAPDFRFDRDTLAFANATVFDYNEGHPSLRKAAKDRPKEYNRRCFVLTRTAMQFHKFARFDPHGAPLDDGALAARIRLVTRRPAWREALPVEQRVNFPGYANLREMSKARRQVLQDNIGIGWATYFRPGNFRMFYQHDEKYQEKTHANLDAALTRGDLFVGYLSSYPWYTINHAILVYARKTARPGSEIDHYLAYDPNHPDAPRELKWSPTMRVFNYQKDEEFVGGFTRVYQVYGKPLQ